MIKKTKVIILIIMTLCCVGFSYLSLEVFEYPSYFPKPIYDLVGKPLSKQKIDLGKKIFYDPILSGDNSVSCASCHSSYNAFAHTDHDLSHGINDQIGTRNAPPLFNLAWQSSFMWDGAINHLDFQPLAPISSPLEMGSNIGSVVKKLNQHPYYPKLFYEAFKDSVITGEQVLIALSQFQITLLSVNSKYDAIRQGVGVFSEQEKKGYHLFLEHCNSCHKEPLFFENKYENNGLKVDTFLNDFGRWNITKVSRDSLKFKIPSLRNLSYTKPYMHDGRLNSLNKVLNHYSNEVVLYNNLAQSLKKGISLSAEDKVDLIAFLLTLNDQKFILNKKHKNPNIYP